MGVGVSESLPRFAFSTIREATSAVKRYADAGGASNLRLLPFNRFEPSESYWWFSPTAENPAFRYGKIAFAGGPAAAPGDLFVGLYLEKGIGPTAAPMFQETGKGRRWVMDGTWRWQSGFYQALRSGRLGEDADSVVLAAGLPITIVLDAGNPVPPTAIGSDESRPIMDVDVVRFLYRDGTLTTLDAELPLGLLSRVAESTTIPELGAWLGAIPKPDWVWIDFHAGVRFARGDTSSEASWSPEDVWSKACVPWLGWVQ